MLCGVYGFLLTIKPQNTYLCQGVNKYLNWRQVINYTTSLFCEIDKYAATSYCAVHDVDASLNLGDITKADERSVPDFNVMFGGSPCTDFSIAGKQGGAMWRCSDCDHEYNPLEAHFTKRDQCPKCGSKEIEKTRSSLIVEWLRFIREKKPRVALYENVKNLVGQRFRKTFDLFVKELEDYGYNVYWQLIDAKHQGIPQHRERVYCVIVRKDLDNGKFRFPDSIPLRRSLYDMCERQVDEKYYLPDEKVTEIVALPKVAYCITSTYHKGIPYEHYLKTHQRQLIMEYEPRYRMRRLTQLECWRLMGFEDRDFFAAQTAMNDNIFGGKDRSGTQLYKQAGNSIVVDVLLHIFENLNEAMPYLFEDIKIGSFFSGIGAFEKALTLLGEPREQPTGDTRPDQLKQIGYINNYNGDANRIYDCSVARALKAEAGGGGAKTGWYQFPERNS